MRSLSDEVLMSRRPFGDLRVDVDGIEAGILLGFQDSGGSVDAVFFAALEKYLVPDRGGEQVTLRLISADV